MNVRSDAMGRERLSASDRRRLLSHSDRDDMDICCCLWLPAIDLVAAKAMMELSGTHNVVGY